MKSKHTILFTLCIVFILGGFVTLFFINEISASLYEFVRMNISSDHIIEGGETSFRTNIYFIIICFFGLAVFFYLLSLPFVKLIIKDFFQNSEVKNYLFQDSYVKKAFTKLVFITAITGNLLIVLTFKFSNNQHLSVLFGEDNFFEWMTAIFFLISSITILIASIRIFSYKSFDFKYRNVVLIGLVLFSILNFWVFGEEISWGQRIFNWQSSEKFTMNFQNETNMHNFFNPIINPLYSLVTFSFAILLLIGWIRNRKETSAIFQIGFPHASLFPSAIIIIYASSAYLEMAELILSLFILLYSLRIYVVSNNIRKNKIQNH